MDSFVMNSAIMIQCQNCKVAVSHEDKFCPTCGAKMPSQDKSKAPVFFASCCLGVVGLIVAIGGTCAAIMSAIATGNGGDIRATISAICGTILFVGALVVFIREALK
jgi:uncharacterized paraquat-inducible protein A